MRLVVAQFGLHAVQRQALLVPGAGSGVGQREPALPSLAVRCHAGLTAELGFRCLRPQRGQIQAVPLGLAPDDGLDLPGGKLGGHLGLHHLGRLGLHCRARRGDRLQTGLQGQQGIGSGQLPRELGRGCHRQGLLAGGQGGLHQALGLQRQCHGCHGLQLTAELVSPGCDPAVALFQRVGLTVIVVNATELGGLQRGGTGPAQAGHLERHLQRDRQAQVGGRRERRGVGAVALVNDGEGRHAQRAQPQLFVEQGGQRPGHVNVVRLHRQVTLLPAQPANVSAGTQRASHVFGLQRLPGR